MKMQNGSLFGSAIEPRCDYCAHAVGAQGGGSCLLGRQPAQNGACRSFRYDPLRRVPRARPPVPKPGAEEFKL
ncbi:MULTISPECIES: hypothetical protein [Caproicibacterium]|uniref:Uncharacterized protein n=1 Tax=Caproicibacterium argilliputei TaxID=3030016 RepID=A0AA97H195_9FIRM|nr:hypothetical protein [Caproicibacterium argilliputei]WOC32416.1 hypothetical protein PXC00_00685 [Caproicibacterium argilliputei]